MTSDEAIERFEIWIESDGEKDVELFKMAIEALKYQQEHQAKEQKCIERLEELEELAYKRVQDTPSNSPCYNRYYEQHRARASCLEIIKEEMGDNEKMGGVT